MVTNLKPYAYSKGRDAPLDSEFSGGTAYGKVVLSTKHLFWKAGLRWFAVPLSSVQRVFRQVEFVYGKLCCGGFSYDIQNLVLILNDRTELILHIGDNQIGDAVKKEAEALYQALQDAHPELQFGKM